MGENEVAVLRTLSFLRTTVFDPILEKYHGRIVKLMGDGTLVEFASVVDAVNCAVEIQQTLVLHNASANVIPMELRIGINLGDIIVDGDDLYGDGVNVAARLEALAEPGGICVSRSVVTQAKSKVDVAFRDLGTKHLKNISEPVQIFAVTSETSSPAPPARRQRMLALLAAGAILLLGVLGWEFLLRPQAAEAVVFDRDVVLAVPTGPKIAVLPFDNLSGVPDQQYFADGMAAQIISELSAYRDLNVLSKNSSFRFRGPDVSLQKVAADMQLDYILEGSVFRGPDQLKLVVQLSNAKTGTNIWSNSYDRPLTPTNLFDVQAEVADTIALKLGDSAMGVVSADRVKRLRNKSALTLSAYDCLIYSPGDYVRPDVLRRQVQCIPKILETDPQNAEALSRMSLLYMIARANRLPLFKHDRETLKRLALENAELAYQINPADLLVVYTYGRARQLAGDRPGFLAAMKQGLELGGARLLEGSIGVFLAFSGEWEIGTAIVQSRIDRDPTSYPRSWNMPFAMQHFMNKDYEKALVGFRKTYFPGSWISRVQMAYTLGQLGRTAEAKEEVDGLLRISSGLTISDVVESYKEYLFDDAYIALMVEGLRAAGMPEGAYPVVDVGN